MKRKYLIEKPETVEVTFYLVISGNLIALKAKNNKGEDVYLLTFDPATGKMSRSEGATMQGIETDSDGRILIEE